MGLAVGAAYGLVQARSPAPPMIALVGLFGMVLGQQAVDMAKRHFRATGSDLHPSTMWAAPRVVLTRLTLECWYLCGKSTQPCFPPAHNWRLGSS
jgi:XapX domain-containing protein